MSEPATDHAPEPVSPAPSPADNSLGTGHRDAVQQLRDQARLVWLFRHDAVETDTHYLRDLMVCFRGLDPW